MLSQQDNDTNHSGTNRSPRRLVVIGAGISGLSAAYSLHCQTADLDPRPEILVFEGSPRVGGCISTYNLDDTILELGPDSFITEKPAAIELCKKLGIEDRLIETDRNHRRTFVAHNGELFRLPEGFLMMAPTQLWPMLTSPLFTFKAKLRMLREIFVRPGAQVDDESLSQFVERRLGKEVLDRVVQPLVGGIYTADPDRLSIRAALPAMYKLEKEYGSLVKGLSAKTKSRNESGARYGMFVTFDQGISVLVNTLVEKLPPASVRTNALVSKLHKHPDGWELEFFDGKRLVTDAVIVATSSFHAADVFRELDSELSHKLSQIEYASSAVLNLIYRRDDIPHPLDGFGFVVPRTERKTILACSFTSVRWPGRTADDRALLRVFIGGALQPDVFALSDEQIECLMWEDLKTYLGIVATPLLSVMSRFPKAMPQYNIGHCDLVSQIENSLAKHSGLALAGNAYFGVGIPDCIASGEKAARRVLDHTAGSARTV